MIIFNYLLKESSSFFFFLVSVRVAFLPATTLKIENVRQNKAVLKFINIYCVFVERSCLIFLGLFTHIKKLATFNVVLMTNEGSPSESTTLTLSVKKCLRDDDYRK